MGQRQTRLGHDLGANRKAGRSDGQQAQGPLFRFSRFNVGAHAFKASAGPLREAGMGTEHKLSGVPEMGADVSGRKERKKR